MNLTARTAEFIRQERLLRHGARVIVGLSGGADSVTLLAILMELGYDCTAVHCHFGLRGEEADRDARFAGETAAGLGARFLLRSFDTRHYATGKGISIEMACRELRYAEFERIRCEMEAEAIAVAHHREDNIETMMLNLLRGSGLHGIKAMLPRRENIVRPLLPCSKQELLNYLEQRQLTYVTDSSNLTDDYKRNKLRNCVLPRLYEAFPEAAAQISKSLTNLRGCDALYTSLLPERTNSLVDVRRSAAPTTLLHEWLAPYGFNSTVCTNILTAASGATFTSPTHRLTVCPGDKYELKALREKCSAKPQLVSRKIDHIKSITFNPKRLYLDASALEGTPRWELRQWQPGDMMSPYGMKGRRMVSDILADMNVATTARPETWLLLRNGVILWIIGMRASSHFPITPNSKSAIEIYEEL